MSRFKVDPKDLEYALAKTGRPSTYRPEYAEQLLQYVEDCLDTEYLKDDEGNPILDKKGKLCYKTPKLPQIAVFAHMINTHVHTLQNWCKARHSQDREHYKTEEEFLKYKGAPKHPEFLAAYARAHSLIQSSIMQGGMDQSFNSQFAQFVLVNNHDMESKSVVDSKNVNLNAELGDISDKVGKDDAAEAYKSLIKGRS